MKSALTLLLLTTTFWCHAQGTPKTLLWRITGSGLVRPAYLYGTVHSKAERAYLHTDLVEQYMDSVGTVAGELDLEAAKKQGLLLMTAMMMPDGMRLEDLYRKKDWKVVDAGLKGSLGPAASMVMRMKPFLVLATLSEAGMEQDRDLMLDDHLLRRAKADEHRVIGLESMEEQLRAMDVLTLKEQAAMLLDHFKNGGYEGEMEAMMVAYAAQDLDALMEVAQASRTMPAKVEESLIDGRNKVMAHRMDSVIHVDGDALFLIGAAHLPGDEGVIQLMRGMGYSVDPVFRSSRPDTSHGSALFLEGGIHYVNDSLHFGVDMPGLPIDAGDGILIHAVREKDRAVFITVVDEDPKGSDLEGFIHQQFDLDARSEVMERRVQGLDGRHVKTRFEEREADMLVVKREGRVLVLTAVDPEPSYREQVLASFHFTDLPD